jgi:hypothetical protein
VLRIQGTIRRNSAEAYISIAVSARARDGFADRTSVIQEHDILTNDLLKYGKRLFSTKYLTFGFVLV